MPRLRLRKTLAHVALIGLIMLGVAGVHWSQATDTVMQPVAPVQPIAPVQPVAPVQLPTLPTVAPLPALLQPVTPIATLDDVPGVTAHVYVVQGQVIVVSNVGVAMQTDLSPSPTPTTTSQGTASTIR